jgi:2-dehydropantoate 2-reductase
MELHDKIAVVTGGGRGIGRAIALAYAREGANLVLAARSKEALEETRAMVEALGHERVLLGFPGAGGKREGHVIRSLLIKQQSTTFGELDGRTTPRMEQTVDAFKSAGFPVAISSNIDAALKTHAVFITGIESAVVVAGGNHELAYRRDLLLLMVTAIREGFKGLQSRGLPIVPFNLKLMFLGMPKWFPVLYWQRALHSKLGEYSLAAHATAAPAEVRHLMAEIRTLVGDITVSAPALDQLYRDMDAISTGIRLRQ